MSANPTPIKQFAVETLPINGTEVYTSPVFTDSRGSLYEAYHVLKSHRSSNVKSIKGIYPARKAVYGPVAHDGEELIFLIRGKLFVFLADSSDHSKHTTLEIEQGTIIRILPNVIHAFLSLEDNTIFDLVSTSTISKKNIFKIDDASLNIQWPASEMPLIQAECDCSTEKQQYDFAIMGSNGLIGSAFVREILARGMTYYQIRSRLNQPESIRNEILAINPRVSVLISAGVGTRPNTRWCETHKMETVDANVTAQLAVAKMCKELNYHCTLIGTCGFYHYDENHPLGSGKGFTEDDIPNNDCNVYYKMRILLEDLLKETGLINNTLNLRAVFPFDNKITSASLIGKLLRFNSITCIDQSMTVLTELVPLAIEMMVDHDTGNVNWVCEGTKSNGDVLEAYKAIVDPSITINKNVITQEQSKSSGNSAAYIVPSRLKSKFGDRVPTLEDSINNLMHLIKKEKEQQ